MRPLATEPSNACFVWLDDGDVDQKAELEELCDHETSLTLPSSLTMLVNQTSPSFMGSKRTTN